MHRKLDREPDIAREWFEKSRLAPTLAEAAFYHRKAQLALERSLKAPCELGWNERIALRRGSHRLLH